MDDHDQSFLADMMPWSEAFKEYTGNRCNPDRCDQ